MNITKIQNIPAGIYQPREIKKSELEKSDELKKTPDAVESKSANVWKKDILLNALDKLENNMQLDDSHPLGRKGNQPIESYEEALIELDSLKKSDFKAQASNAQANIEAKNILSLFVEMQTESEHNYYDII